VPQRDPVKLSIIVGGPRMRNNRLIECQMAGFMTRRIDGPDWRMEATKVDLVSREKGVISRL
jgi:hypothetical protein